MGALRRTLAADAAATSRSSTRAFSVSARRCDESNDAAPAAPVAAKPDSRKARAANALNQINRLGANRRAALGGLAKGSFPSGQGVEQSARSPPRDRPEGGLKITRELVGSDAPSTGAPPPGAMARAPARLKLSRPPTTGPRGGSSPRGNASVGGARRGPNLRGRDGKPGGGSNKAEQRPQKRVRPSEGDDSMTMDVSNVQIDSVLSDTMVQHLLRLQRAEWDRKPYTPKYAPSSFAANQLIHAGRELFRGEAPPVKIWGPLERRIGVVGMHGAEAHLQVRRVPYDGPELGERREYFETGDVEGKAEGKGKKTADAAKVKAPAPAITHAAAAASAPASKQAAAVQ